MGAEPADRAAAEVHTAPELAVPLRAGPLRLVFDRGGLRWIRLGEREVLRGIYAAVRDESWFTVPAVLEDLEIEAEPESFRIRFRARHGHGCIRFDWDARIEGAPDGRISFRMDGAAGSTFRRNRIGLCVLHPAEECAGRPCIVETTDGDRLEQAFPALVSPHQPFRNVRAILHAVTAGVEAEVRMEGETFETEDHRNWSDASFKTYGTPLHLPHPVEVVEGTRVEQAVTLSLFGLTAEPVRDAAAVVPGALPKKRNSTEPVVVRVGVAHGVARPRVGLGGAGLVALDDAAAGRLRPLRLAHLRADLRLGAPGWEQALERAIANARALDAPLELALFLPDEPGAALRHLADRASALRPRVASWLTFRAGDSVTGEGDVALGRRFLAAVDPSARFGGGADGHFTEVNRRRSAAIGVDRLVFALHPQAHATDDCTVFENVASLSAVAETARNFAGGASLGISPVTLRSRVDKRPASSRESGEPPFTDDPRQKTWFAAGWVLAFLAAAAEAGFDSLTFFELVGPRGVMDGGGAFPVFDALADAVTVPEAFVVPTRSRRPERVQAVALRSAAGVRVFLTNVTADSHPVRVEGLSGRVRRAALGDGGPGADAGFEIELGPHEVARLDVSPARAAEEAVRRS
jgi:D-apionolactonase